MKLLWVLPLLSIFLYILIFLMDLVMWKSLNVWSILKLETNPFVVLEPAEYFIIFMIIVHFAVRTVVSLVQKRKQKQSP